MPSRYEAEAESATASARLATGVGSPPVPEGSGLLGPSASRRLTDGERDATGVAGGCSGGDNPLAVGRNEMLIVGKAATWSSSVKRTALMPFGIANRIPNAAQGGNGERVRIHLATTCRA